ncbi:MAG: glycosyltransferase [Verrucomicrobia bacterium]|nr:glycosyltransferase [Verrucomicrobiota bacterium]MDA1087933.1 glycosyltransferase [Verrucomicrobiota bacterium]
MDFVIIANSWEAGIANPTSKHHIARQLALKGNRVLWVTGAGMRRPSLGSGTDRSRIFRKLVASLRAPRLAETTTSDSGGVWVLSPLLIPLPSVGWVRRLNGWIYSVCAGLWARRLNFRNPVMINYVPVLAHAMRRWKGVKVYHCVDRWDAFEMYDSALMSEMDSACCRYADLVITSAGDLYDRCKEKAANVHLVMHGVDHSNFATALDQPPRPDDLPAGSIIGFFGLLSEWFDQSLVLALARALPDTHVVLIGDADVDVDALRGQPNIHLLGARRFAELPRYIAHFAIGIIPFVVNELTFAVNPVKLREMMAAGCPVVSTALPEVERYAGTASLAKGERGGVRVVADEIEFFEAVRNWLEAPATLSERETISKHVAAETWEAKTGEILHLIEALT